LTYEEILKSIKAKKFVPIYVLHGDESYFIDQISDLLEASVLPEAERGFNQTVLYGKDVDYLVLLDYLRRYPMMSQYQTVFLREAQEMKTLSELVAYAENPMATTILVICHKHKKLDLRTKFGKTVAAKAVVFEAKKLYDNQIPDWITSTCSSKGLKIELPAASLMAEYLGTDLGKIAGEIEKLSLNLAKGTSITENHIQEFVGISKEYNVFELQKAMATRDMARIARISQYFSANIKKNPLIVTVVSLFGFFSKVYMVHSLKAQGASEATMLKELDLRSEWFLRDYKAGSLNFTAAKTVAIISLLREYDLKSKGVDMDLTHTGEEELMKELFFKILH
jgi:DNA polymerase III subunit delta